MDEQTRIRTHESQAARLAGKDHTGKRLRFYAATIILAVLLPIAAPAPAQILQSLLLQTERAGHSATLLGDGRVLIAGGANQGSASGTAERYDPATEASSAVGKMTAQRTDHAAVLLADGRVLVTGGRNAGGTLATSEIFDPAAGAFTSAPSLKVARYGHSATALADGRVLIAGGDLDGSAEIYDPGTGSFTLLAAQMWAPHAFHGAMLRTDGTVFIVGGIAQSESTVLALAESFDPATTSFAPASALQIARARPTLRALPDGKIQVAGGTDNGEVEIYDPQTRSFTVRVPALVPPLTVSDLLRARTRSALIHPQAQGSTPADVYALVDRSEYTLTELAASNRALVAGGVNGASQPSSSALIVPSSPASVTTQRSDYHPGQHVTVSGSGFAPNETVSLQFHEEPETHPDVLVSATASASGSFTNTDFAPVQGDIGRRFTLTAIGQSSGVIAQTGFNDAGPITFVGNIGTNSFTNVANSSITVTVGASGVSAGNSIIVTLRVGSFAGAIGCSDTKGNTYNTDISSLPGAARGAIVSAHNVTALVSGDVITCTYPGFSGLSLVSANEFSGLAAAPQDQSSQLSSSNAGAATSGLTPTTTQADELVFGLFNLGAVAQTITPATSGSNPLESPYVPAYTKVGVIATMNPMYRVVAATRQYESNGTVAGSGGWRSQVVTYKGSTATTGTLTVTKVVDNTGGGTRVVADFPLFVDAAPVTSGAANAFATGPHTVSETAGPAYTAVISGDCASDGTITLAAGDIKACTITNTFIPPKLTVTKVVDNTGGGTKVVADFPLFVDATPVTSGVQITSTAGAHTVSETTDPTYTAVISGDCAADGSITLAGGDVKACTITNTFIPPKLTVTKVVVNTGGGTKVVADFPLFVDATPVTSGVQNSISPGAHTVSETTDPTYTAVISGDCAANGSITLAGGDVKACTITNTFNAPKLTVTKVVVNTGGGTKVVGDFALFVDATPVTSGVQITSTTGAHTVSETVDPNYTEVISGDCAANGSITLAAGDVKACTITNTFKAPKLTVTKVVVNTGGGTKVVADFPLFVDATPVTSGVQITSTAGAHTVSETVDPNYTEVISGDCAANGSITLAAGDVKACTITNTFKSAQLTVTKVVVNTGGGTKVIADFPLFVDAAPVTSGVQVAIGSGAHTVSETADPSYTEVISGDCAANGSITLAAGDVKACTITNTFKAPKITVTKVVVNTGGGTKVVADFPLFVDATPVTSGVQVTSSTGVHTVSETADPSYIAAISGDCAANGSITLAAGDVKACTITNTFNAPKLTVTKVVVNTGGGTKAVGDFALFVDATPVTSGVQVTSSTGVHTVSEAVDPSYTAVISGDCAANGSITLAAGDVKACTITNTFRAAATVTISLTLPLGGSGVFNLQIDGQTVAPNVGSGGSSGPVPVGAGQHTVGETAGIGTNLADYNTTIDCGNGPVAGTSTIINVTGGVPMTCTITNVLKQPVVVTQIPTLDPALLAALAMLLAVAGAWASQRRVRSLNASDRRRD